MNELLTANQFLKEAEKQGTPISYKTLRLYIDLGFIPKPEKRGRYVGYYNPNGLLTIKTIKNLLQRYQLKLAQIRDLKTQGANLDELKELFESNSKDRDVVLKFINAGFTSQHINLLLGHGGDGLLADDIKSVLDQYPKRKYNILFLKGDIERIRNLEKKRYEQRIKILDDIQDRLEAVLKKSDK